MVKIVVSTGQPNARKRNPLQLAWPIAKAKAKVLEMKAEGHTTDQCMVYVGRTPKVWEQWRAQDPAFKQAADEIRILKDSARQGGGPPPVGSFEEFCPMYLGMDLHPHQLRWIDLLEGRAPRALHPSMIFEQGLKTRIITNVPPNHGKSTTLSISYVVYRICQDPNVRIIIVSKTQKMAKTFLRGVKQRLAHPKFLKLQVAFGPEGGFKNSAEVWAADEIFLGEERDSGEKDPTVQALGIGGQIYGARADLIIVDDAVQLSNAHEFDNQISWVTQEAASRLSPPGILMLIGTRVAPQDLYRELRNTERYPDGKSPWTYLSQPAVLEVTDSPKDWVTLWPRATRPFDGREDEVAGPDGMFRRWDGPELHTTRGQMDTRTWSLAYMQADISEDAIFGVEAVKSCVNGMRRPGRLVAGAPRHRAQGMQGLYVVAGLDPAMAGDAGIVVLGVDRQTKQRFVLEVVVKTGPTPKWIRDTIKQLTETLDVNEWRIEKNAFQTFLTQDEELRNYLASRGVLLYEHHTGRNKWDVDFGVASMAPMFDQKLIELPSTSNAEGVSMLIHELVTWSPKTKNKTDLVMALWFAEIRARELATVTSGQRTHVANRYLSKNALASRWGGNVQDLVPA